MTMTSGYIQLYQSHYENDEQKRGVIHSSGILGQTHLSINERHFLLSQPDEVLKIRIF